MTESSCQDKRCYQSGHLGKNTNHRHSWLLILFNKAILSLHSNNPASLLGITFNQIVVSGKSWVCWWSKIFQIFVYDPLFPTESHQGRGSWPLLGLGWGHLMIPHPCRLMLLDFEKLVCIPHNPSFNSELPAQQHLDVDDSYIVFYCL